MSVTEIHRQCLKCFYAQHGDPDAPPSQILIGEDHRLCLQGPPTTFPVPTQHGMAFMTVYPTVNGQTISCRQFVDRETVAEINREFEALHVGGGEEH